MVLIFTEVPLKLLLFFLATAISAQTIDVGFADHGQDPSAKDLVLKTIQSAKFELRMACYNFSDPDIITALVMAKKRGVDVQVVHDKVSIPARHVWERR